MPTLRLLLIPTIRRLPAYAAAGVSWTQIDDDLSRLAHAGGLIAAVAARLGARVAVGAGRIGMRAAAGAGRIIGQITSRRQKRLP